MGFGDKWQEFHKCQHLLGQYINITIIIYEFEWIRFILQNKLRSVFPSNNLVELVKTNCHTDLRAFVGQLQQHHCPLKILT
jgi:hypothetical protein